MFDLSELRPVRQSAATQGCEPSTNLRDYYFSNSDRKDRWVPLIEKPSMPSSSVLVTHTRGGALVHVVQNPDLLPHLHFISPLHIHLPFFFSIENNNIQKCIAHHVQCEVKAIPSLLSFPPLFHHSPLTWPACTLQGANDKVFLRIQNISDTSTYIDRYIYTYIKLSLDYTTLSLLNNLSTGKQWLLSADWSKIRNKKFLNSYD